MDLDLFDFELPRDRIAQRPAEPRESARLLRVSAGLEDLHVSDLPSLLHPGDLLIYNDTKVIPARLPGRRLNDLGGDAAIEVTLHREISPGAWWVFAKPARKMKQGDRLVFSETLQAEVTGRSDDGQVELVFDDTVNFWQALGEIGQMPLPPYIERSREGDAQDRHDYQTIFAQVPGAVAAPTAGLHFTPDLMAALKEKGVQSQAVTLHVGGGTFLPVKTDDVEEHQMHSEWGKVDQEVVEAVSKTKAAGGRVVALGTTSLRILESAAGATGRLERFSGETDLFILPGYRFAVIDVLITNFHLPRSTLFMLVSAFCGLETMQAAYAHARDSGYRFFSYGDACFLERAAEVG